MTVVGPDFIVAALFVKTDSVYKSIPGVDCYDCERDARTFQGPLPIVTHPPGRGWGCLRQMSKASDDEKDLGPWAVDQVRRWGGVLEHPRGSLLWRKCGLPRAGRALDSYGGFSLDVDQFWWGHRAQKRTWLYVVGCSPADIPRMALRIGRATHVVTNIHGLRSGDPGYRPEISKSERDATPPAFARWLIDLAAKCRKVTG